MSQDEYIDAIVAFSCGMIVVAVTNEVHRDGLPLCLSFLVSVVVSNVVFFPFGLVDVAQSRK